MVDCACTNFPANLGHVTIGAYLGVGMVQPAVPAGNVDVRSGGTTTPMSIKFGRTGEDGTLGVAGIGGQWSQQANAGDTTLRSMTASLNLSVQNDGGRILFTTGTADTTKLAITNFGHVGIGLGTAMPSERLEVRGPSATSPVAITIGRSAAEGALAVSAGENQWAAPTVAGDVVLRSSSGSLVLAAITSGNIVLATGSSGRMTITNAGNVGIGTASPIGKLEVNGGGVDTQTYLLSGNAARLVAFNVGRASTDGTLGVANGSGIWSAQAAAAGDVVLRSSPGSLILSAQNGGKIVLSTGAPSQSDAARVTITNAGNVGIGTATPASRLDAAGTIRATAQTDPSVGEGVELLYTGTEGQLKAFARPSGPYRRLVIDSSPLVLNLGSGANVGIGITQPTSRLSIQGGIRLGDSPEEAGVANALMIRRAGADSVTYIRMINEGTVTGSISSGGSGRRGDLVFSNDAGGSYVFGTGNVGIGTNSPLSKLEVDGPASGQGYTADFSGDLKVGGLIDVASSGHIAVGTRKIADNDGCYYA